MAHADRDRLLDMLRAIAIVRVVIVHLSGATKTLAWPALTFVAPGMPLVFFVSGALAVRSLDPRRGDRSSDRTFRVDRLRRLMLPYWCLAGTVAAVVWCADLLSPLRQYNVRWHMVLAAAVPVVVPKMSSRLGTFTGHLWFMSAFLVLTLVAPQLVRLHRRSAGATLGVVAAVFVAVQAVDLAAPGWVPRELDRLSLFALCYVLGFWYQDGRLKWRTSYHLLAAAALALAAIAYHRFDGRILNATEPMHAAVGLAWLQLALMAAPVLQAVARRHRRLLSRVTRRTFTVYLWGWPATMLAVRSAGALGYTGAHRTVWIYAVTLLGLAVAVAVFGRAEDVAARRQPATAPPPAAA